MSVPTRRVSRLPRNMSNGTRNNRGLNVGRRMLQEMHGTKFAPPETPPVFTGQPWNNMTVILRRTASEIEKITINDIRTSLRPQAGFNNIPETQSSSANVHFDLRIKAFSVWAIDLNSLTFMPMDLISNQSELCRLDSNAQRNMYARAGYKLPLAQSSVTLSTAQQGNKVVCIVMGSKKIELHVSLLWKGADSAQPTLKYVYPLSDFKAKKRKELLQKRAEILALMAECEDDDSDQGSMEMLNTEVDQLIIDETSKIKPVDNTGY